ncbi:hypothetical protein [Fulvivirga lutea]|uniref:Uncharacterized protein n=1 Tax=Fulvivirga lutea TaxID=2810512 RepID=A0A974WJI4_9BACT|nr:hypothetical protein [Fulvivirga lutea]QSE96498.1 hypothetical protein JR347_12925 [Fulvivirga lutea]
MLQIDSSYKPLMLEALEEMMYKLSLELNKLKGGPMDKQRKLLTDKQAKIEKLQHIISISED